MPKRNLVILAESRYQISKRVFAEAMASLSSADFSGGSGTGQLLEEITDPGSSSGDNLASLMRFGWSNQQQTSEYSIGYQTVGSNYVTLGNLFLLNNRNALRLEGKQKFSKGKGQIRAYYLKYSPNGNGSEATAATRQDQISGELSWRIGKKGSRVWARYSPCFFFQNLEANAISAVQLNLASIGGQWILQRKNKGQWVSMVQLTNYSDQSSFGDTTIFTGSWYGMLSQTYSTDKYQLSVLTNLGIKRDNWRVLQDFNVEINHSFSMKNVQWTQGTQILKRVYDKGTFLGGVGNLQLKLNYWLRLGVGGAYYWALKKDQKNQFYLNTTANWRF
jgi:hypothetical protein